MTKSVIVKIIAISEIIFEKIFEIVIKVTEIEDVEVVLDVMIVVINKTIIETVTNFLKICLIHSF